MVTIDAFLSCSFDSADEDIVTLVKAISRALGFVLTNVSTGAPQTPPHVAKQKIESAQCLIGVCTRRSELKTGGFVMPQAVQDELAIAFGTDTPTIMLVEQGVEVVGFKPNYGTYTMFKREALTEAETIHDIVAALQALRVAIRENEANGVQGMSGSYADKIQHLVQLEVEGDDFVWQYETFKRLVYTQSPRGSFPASVWATLPGQIPDTAQPIKWSIETISSSRDIKVIPTIDRQTASAVEARLHMEPLPEASEFVEYVTQSRSRYLNPIWDHEANDIPARLEKGDYKACDGLLFIHRTKSAIIEFRFARSYGLRVKDIVPFVSSYTSGVDYEVPSELERASVKFEDFAGNITVRMEIENPLPNLFYGIAWNPRKNLNTSLC